jgi:hypothetical protein
VVKKIVMYFLAVAFLGLFIYAIYLAMAVADSKRKSQEKIVVEIENPNCFLPKTDKELKNLFKRLKESQRWKLTAVSEPKDPETKGLLALCSFENGVEASLIDIKEKDKWFQNLNGLFNEHACDEKHFRLNVRYDEISTLYASTLLLKSNKVGLLVREWSRDKKRKPTQDALNSLSAELRP